MGTHEITEGRQRRFMDSAGRTLTAFLDGLSSSGPVAILCHSDADGLAAGAILVRTLRARGRETRAIATAKGEGAWAPGTLATLQHEIPDASGLIVCDLGVRSRTVWPGMPTLLIDHHHPAGMPEPGIALVISAYDQDPIPTSGLVAYWAITPPETPLPEAGPDPREWIAAVSLLSDLGDKAPFALLADAKKRWGAACLRQATALLNAPRRSSAADASAALRLLLRCEHPRQVADRGNPDSEALFKAKEEVDAAYELAKRAAPKFSGPVAIVRIHTPCQVHPLIAQIWRSRLPKYLVVAANTGYRPGWVHFSARSRPGTNLVEFLREHQPAGADPETYGNGHEQAAGGALTFPAWNEFVGGLGFGPELQVLSAEIDPEVPQP